MGSQIRETTSDIVGFAEEEVVMVIESLITSLVLRVICNICFGLIKTYILLDQTPVNQSFSSHRLTNVKHVCQLVIK